MFITSSSKAIEILFVNKAELKTLKLRDNASQQIAEMSYEANKLSYLPIHTAEGNIEMILAGTEGLEEDPRNWIRLGAYLSQSLPKGKDYILKTFNEEVALGWGLGKYQFQTYKSQKVETASSHLVIQENMKNKLETEVGAVTFARDLINSPSNQMRPSHLEEVAQQIAKDHGLKMKVIEGEDLLKQNYPTIHAVGKGSDNAPRLIELRGGGGKHKVTIIGKAVCFDTGGYDIKPSSGMRNMKKDMGGGALALALTRWVCEEKLPIEFRMLVPAVENRISDKAFVPGDIIKTRKGKFVEIDNTDAEGRLVLCDALAAACEEEVDLIIDFATLTGACRVALGPDMPGFFTDNEAWASDLQDLSFQVKDPVWRLPLWKPYLSMLRSSPADLSNSASTGHGGAITAALYLKDFVKDSKKWMHFDTYCWSDDVKPGTPQGADTQSLRAVFHFLQRKFIS